MKKIWIAIIILVFVVLLVFILRKSGNETSKVCFPEVCFNVELAKTDAEMEKGLMFRESLPENQGMLFIFESSGKHAFWMKNTLIPLDIVWIDDNFTVVDIKTVEPCKNSICESFAPEKDALYVLEINGGLTGKSNIKIGDDVEIRMV